MARTGRIAGGQLLLYAGGAETAGSAVCGVYDFGLFDLRLRNGGDDELGDPVAFRNREISITKIGKDNAHFAAVA